MEPRLEFGKCYRITLNDGTSFRFRFKGSIPGVKVLYERLDDYTGAFDFHQIKGFKSIIACA
jgi:hypothetical protein